MVSTLPPPTIPTAARKGRVWPRALPGPSAGGVDQVVDEPSAVVGMESNEVKALVGEPTEEYPEGQPELMTITNADGMQGDGRPAPEPDDDGAMMRGLRKLLQALGMGEEPGYKNGGRVKVQPKKYASGGAVLMGPRAYTGVAPGAGGGRSAYLSEQERVAQERMAARQRLDAMRPSEQQRVTTDSESYKYSLGGLARPKTAFELAEESEDQADVYRQHRLDIAGVGSERESYAQQQSDRARADQNRADDDRDRAEAKAEREADRLADLRDAEEDRRQAILDAQADARDQSRSNSAADKARKDAQTQALQEYYRSLNQRNGYNYASGGKVLFGPSYVNELADLKSGTKRIDAESKRSARSRAARNDEEDYKTDQVVKMYGDKAKKALAGPSSGRFSRYKDEDLETLTSVGAISRGEASQELVSRGMDSTQIADTFDFPAKARAKAERDKEEKKTPERFKYSTDSLGRYSDDDLLDMHDKKVIDDATVTAALKARGYSQEEINTRWRYFQASKSKAAAPARPLFDEP